MANVEGTCMGTRDDGPRKEVCDREEAAELLQPAAKKRRTENHGQPESAAPAPPPPPPLSKKRPEPPANKEKYQNLHIPPFRGGPNAERPASSPVASAYDPSSSCAPMDDDCAITGSSGENALVDFAHPRNCCGVKPFTMQSAADFCSNCYCVICDKPVAKCCNWSEHCSADPEKDDKVRELRTFIQQNGAYPAAKCDLKQLTQVYPTEVDVPLVGVTLKDYQRQVVAFMADNERDGFDPNPVFSETKVRCGECVRNTDRYQTIHGGIIALEMGMGKTLCALALCKHRRMPTLVIAPPLCCVQWKTQVQKYVPELSVESLYCQSARRMEQTLLRTDIVVVASSSVLIDSVAKRVARVFVDESHDVLVNVHGGATKFLHNLNEYSNVRHVWLVSGTPFGNSDSIEGQAFQRQLSLLLRRKNFQTIFKIKEDATTIHIKRLLMRMEKTQTTTEGVSSTFFDVPEPKYKTLPVGLNATERELYEIAACMDGWKHKPLDLVGMGTLKDEQITKELVARTTFRSLVLGERIAEFQELAKKELDENFYNPDSEAPDRFFAIVDRMTCRIEKCCKALLDSSSKIDAVLAEIESTRKADPTFKAVVITESSGAGRYIKSKLRDRAGVMQRPKGRTSVHAAGELLKFQTGAYDVLVCSFETVRIGTNLDEACAIYFVDSSINDTEHKQACARIARQGTKHVELTATFVFVKGTLSERVYKYHEDRRSGKTIREAAARFETDDPHDYGEPRDFHKFVYGRPFDGFQCESRRLPDRGLADLFTADMSIDDMFEICGDANDLNDDEYEITLTLAPEMRPALYDYAKQIVISATGGSFRATFDLPDPMNDVSEEERLSTRVRLTKEQADVLSTVDTWHKNLSSGPVAIDLILKTGAQTKLHATVSVIKASCSCCRWCGWRQVHHAVAPTVGYHALQTRRPVFQRGDALQTRVTDDTQWVTVPNEELLVVETLDQYDGCLYARLRHDLAGRKHAGYGFSPVTAKFKTFWARALQDQKRMGVVPRRLRYDMLSHDFFKSKPDIYQKVLVKLSGDVNIEDTIRFEYKQRQYEAFVRETVRSDDDWYAVAYVVESEKPTSVIIVNSHTVVDTTRGANVGNDALSIKDIIRIVRGDAAKAEKLKAILLRRDISDDEKQRLATELVA